jgi:hypothetical protein
MLIKTVVLDGTLEPAMLGQCEMDPKLLFQFGADRVEMVRREGAERTAQLLPAMGEKLVETLKKNPTQDQLFKVSVEIALAAWMMDSVFGGIDEETFAKCDLAFTILPGGAVKYDRLPASQGVSA